jgi:hypothetical protein
MTRLLHIVLPSGEIMADYRTDFRIKVSQPDSPYDPRASDEARRKAFWAPIVTAFRRDDSEEQIDVDQLEDALRRNLPRHLHSELVRLFSDRRSDSSPAIPIVFTVTQIRYSSMELGINVEPLSKLITLFDGNFDYFRAAFEGFVHEAVRDSIQFGPWHSAGPAQTAAAARLRESVEFEPSLAAAFVLARQDIVASNQSQLSGTSPETSAADRARWTWIAANTSLLVPTALFAGYLYLAHQDLREEERMRPDEYHKIIDQEMRLLSTCGAMLSQATPPKKGSLAPSP